MFTTQHRCEVSDPDSTKNWPNLFQFGEETFFFFWIKLYASLQMSCRISSVKQGDTRTSARSCCCFLLDHPTSISLERHVESQYVFLFVRSENYRTVFKQGSNISSIRCNQYNRIFCKQRSEQRFDRRSALLAIWVQCEVNINPYRLEGTSFHSLSEWKLK